MVCPVSNVRDRRSITVKSKSEAVGLAGALAQTASATRSRLNGGLSPSLAERDRPARKEITVDQACGKYWLDRGRALKWADDVKRHLLSIVRVYGEDLALAALGNAQVAQLVEQRQADGAGAAGVNRTLAVLRQVVRRSQRVHGYEVQAIHWPDHWQKEPKGRARTSHPTKRGD